MAKTITEWEQEENTIGDGSKVIIAGSRSFADYEKLRSVCDSIFPNQYSEPRISILSGTSSGSDSLGERYANERGYTLYRYPANWKQYGKAAGPIRNRQMVEDADAAIVFWDGQSRGTKNLIEQANKQGLIVRIIMYNVK